MGWLIALAVVLVLAALPLGVSVKYDAQGPLVRLIAGFIRVTLYPRKPGRSGEKAGEETRQAKKESPSPEQPHRKEGGRLTDFLPLVQLALDFLGDLRKKLRVNRLELKLTMAGDDPCDLAVNYGRAWAAVGNLLPQLERLFVIKKRDVDVACDFTAEQSVIYVRLDMTVTLGRILGLAAVYGVRVLRELMKITNQRKGGAVK